MSSVAMSDENDPSFSPPEATRPGNNPLSVLGDKDQNTVRSKTTEGEVFNDADGEEVSNQFEDSPHATGNSVNNPQEQDPTARDEEGTKIFTPTGLGNLDDRAGTPALELADMSSSQIDQLMEALEQERRSREYVDSVVDERHREADLQESVNESLRQEVERYKKELQQVKDHVFRIQPRRIDITESEAVDKFRTLYENIVRWVQNRLDPLLCDLDDGHLQKRGPPSHGASLLKLTRDPARRCFDAKDSDELHVVAVIMQYLYRAIFRADFYCPLDDTGTDASIAFIQDVLKSMASLPRDAAQCRDWRCEALTALTHKPDFKDRQSRHIAEVSEDLAAILSAIVPRLTVESGDLRRSVQSTIVEPAMALAHGLQLSTKLYTFRWASGDDRQVPLSTCSCLNLSAGGKPVAGPYGNRPVRYLFDVAPGLYVEEAAAAKGATPKPLFKPVVLVNDGDREPQQTFTIMTWLSTSKAHGSTPRQTQDNSQNSTQGNRNGKAYGFHWRNLVGTGKR